MDGTASPGGSADFLRQLLEIRQDPEIKRLARRRARDSELAEDALNQAYEAVARRDPKQIKDLRRYYSRTLINTAYALRCQFKAYPTEDLERFAETHQDRPGSHAHPSRPLDETVCVELLGQTWLEPFATQRSELAARVPRRSPDAERYRDVIVTTAEQVLRAILTEDVSDADSNSKLAGAYPEWFAEPRCADNTCHQRFCRARADVRGLLRTIVSRDDLYP